MILRLHVCFCYVSKRKCYQTSGGLKGWRYGSDVVCQHICGFKSSVPSSLGVKNITPPKFKEWNLKMMGFPNGIFLFQGLIFKFQC